MARIGNTAKTIGETTTPSNTNASLKDNESEHRQLIAKAAYFKWQHRGSSHGGHLADWLDAETEINNKIPE